METNTLAVQSIPLTKIRPNPNNPRRVITDEAVEKKAISLKANGQESPVKLRLLAHEERQAANHKGQPPEIQIPSVPSGQALATAPTLREPQGPEQSRRVEAPPRDDGDLGHDEIEYELIDGELRYRAALNLGWETLDSLVYEITAEDAEWKSVMSNEWEEMHWLVRAEAMERRLQKPPKITQQEIADKKGVDAAIVSRALKLVALLNASARLQILERLKISAPYQVSEKAAFQLTLLEDPQKSPEENQSLVGRTLQVILNRQLTEPEAKRLVLRVKTGHDPETFGEKTTKSMPDDPLSRYWDALPGFVKVSQGKKGYEIRMTVPPSMAITAAYGAMSNMEYVKGLAQQPEDRMFRQALPEITQAAVKAWMEEQQSENKEAQQKEVLRQARSKAAAERKAQKDEAKSRKALEKETKAQRVQQAQIARQERTEASKAQAAAELENHKTVIRQKAETLFGQSPLTDGLVQKCHEGNKAEALKAAKFYLSQSGSNPEEQASALEGFKKDLNEHGRMMKKAGVTQTKPRKTTVRSHQPEIPTSQTAPIGAAPRDDGSTKQNSSGGLLDKLAEVVEQKTGLTAQDIKDGVEGMLAKDLKQAGNYEVRRVMRNFLKKIF